MGKGHIDLTKHDFWLFVHDISSMYLGNFFKCWLVVIWTQTLTSYNPPALYQSSLYFSQSFKYKLTSAPVPFLKMFAYNGLLIHTWVCVWFLRCVWKEKSLASPSSTVCPEGRRPLGISFPGLCPNRYDPVTNALWKSLQLLSSARTWTVALFFIVPRPRVRQPLWSQSGANRCQSRLSGGENLQRPQLLMSILRDPSCV